MTCRGPRHSPIVHCGAVSAVMASLASPNGQVEDGSDARSHGSSGSVASHGSGSSAEAADALARMPERTVRFDEAIHEAARAAVVAADQEATPAAPAAPAPAAPRPPPGRRMQRAATMHVSTSAAANTTKESTREAPHLTKRSVSFHVSVLAQTRRTVAQGITLPADLGLASSRDEAVEACRDAFLRASLDDVATRESFWSTHVAELVTHRETQLYGRLVQLFQRELSDQVVAAKRVTGLYKQRW